MVKRNVLVEHVYTFLIISGAICILRRNQPIRAGQGQAAELPHLKDTFKKNDIGEQRSFE